MPSIYTGSDGAEKASEKIYFGRFDKVISTRVGKGTVRFEWHFRRVSQRSELDINVDTFTLDKDSSILAVMKQYTDFFRSVYTNGTMPDFTKGYLNALRQAKGLMVRYTMRPGSNGTTKWVRVGEFVEGDRNRKTKEVVILEFLIAGKGRSWSPKEISEGLDIKPLTVRNCLMKHKANGLAVNPSKGRWSISPDYSPDSLPADLKVDVHAFIEELLIEAGMTKTVNMPVIEHQATEVVTAPVKAIERPVLSDASDFVSEAMAYRMFKEVHLIKQIIRDEIEWENFPKPHEVNGVTGFKRTDVYERIAKEARNNTAIWRKLGIKDGLANWSTNDIIELLKLT